MNEKKAPESFATAKSPLPRAAILEMTFRCSHECVYCSCPWYAPESRYPVGPPQTAGEYIKMIDHLVDDCGVAALTFSGGEPLLFDGLRRVIDHAASKEVDYPFESGGGIETRRVKVGLYLITNGSLLDASWLDYLKDRGVGLGISLPGLKTYNLHTGSKLTSPEKILGLIGEAAKRRMPVTANVTITKANFFEAYETMAEALLAGASFLLLNRFLPGGRGLRFMKELFMDRARTAELLDIAEDVLKTANRNGSTGTEIPFCMFPGKKFEKLHIASDCSAGTGFFALDAAGYMRVCNHSPVRLSHWSEAGSVMENPYFRKFVRKEYFPEECSGCARQFECDCGCREAAHIISKRLDAPDPVFEYFGTAPPKDLLG